MRSIEDMNRWAEIGWSYSNALLPGAIRVVCMISGMSVERQRKVYDW